MGLDMYLTKRIYIGAQYRHNNVKGVINLTKGENDAPNYYQNILDTIDILENCLKEEDGDFYYQSSW